MYQAPNGANLGQTSPLYMDGVWRRGAQCTATCRLRRVYLYSITFAFINFAARHCLVVAVLSRRQGTTITTQSFGSRAVQFVIGAICFGLCLSSYSAVHLLIEKNNFLAIRRTNCHWPRGSEPRSNRVHCNVCCCHCTGRGHSPLSCSRSFHCDCSYKF